MRISAVPVLLCALLLSACAQDMNKTDDHAAMAAAPSAEMQPPAAQASGAGKLPDGIYPASQESLPTTAGSIYLANVNARIDALMSTGAAKPGGNWATPSLAGMLYHRFQILGRIDDVDRALALMDTLKDPNAKALRTRAALRSGLHRFDEAQADLAQAAKLSHATAGDAKARQGMALATGDYAQIKDLIDNASQPSPHFGETILRANLAAFKGDLANASAQFLRAQQTINDTDPYPIAWLFAQQGLTLERFDQCDKAMPFFEAAEARLPGYALAMDHQAECLLRLHKLDAARKVYQQLIPQTGNPEYLGGLARVEKEAGHDKLAQQLEAKTASGYDSLLTREPKAWSEHAAEYYLAVGQNQKALQAARVNLDNRRDVLSLILMARAAQANGERARSCKALTEVQASGLQPPELNYWKDELPSCGATLALKK